MDKDDAEPLIGCYSFKGAFVRWLFWSDATKPLVGGPPNLILAKAQRVDNNLIYRVVWWDFFVLIVYLAFESDTSAFETDMDIHHD